MQGLELNKIMAAVLVALILSKAGDLLSRGLISPKPLTQNAYQVAGMPVAATATQNTAQELEPIEPLLAGADVERGKVVAKKCVQCHTFDQGGPNRVGPNLWAIVGAKHAHVEGFAYSSALKNKEGVWDYAALNAFLYKPRVYAPGTKMAFAGLEKAKDRADMIAYLRTLSPNPVPLPAPGAP